MLALHCRVIDFDSEKGMTLLTCSLAVLEIKLLEVSHYTGCNQYETVTRQNINSEILIKSTTLKTNQEDLWPEVIQSDAA